MQPRILGSQTRVGKGEDDRGDIVSNQKTIECNEKPTFMIQSIDGSEHYGIDYK